MIKDVDKHFINEKIDSGMICMPYVPTTEQIVDMLTRDFKINNLAT